ncbi:MAG: hypothetical protein H8D05_00920 [FCB group bacterium]|nr:hypothetical protein [FCB group bacterium]
MSVYLLILIQLIGYGPWELVGPEGGEVKALLQSTQNDSTFFAISGANPTQVLSSTNSGDTWATISDFFGNALDMVMTENGTLIALGSSRIWISDDNGLTWVENYISNRYFEDGVVHPTDGDRIFAAGQVYSGGNWNMTFFNSSDGGNSWSETELVASANTSYGKCVAVSRSNPDFIMVGGYESVGGLSTPYIFKSTDGGASFTAITPTEASYYINSVAFHPDDSDILLAGALTKMYRSTDGGSTWSENAASLYYNYGMTFSTVDTDLVMCGANDSKIHMSSDAGQTWTSITTGLSGEGIKWVVPDASDVSKVYTGSTSGFFRSNDEGYTWDINNSGLLVGNVMCIEYMNGEIFLNMEDLGLFKATDGAELNWTEVTMPLDCGNFCALESTGADTILAFEGSG